MVRMPIAALNVSRNSPGKNGWPSSSLAPEPPQTEDEQVALIDALQDWKTLHYQELIGGFWDLW